MQECLKPDECQQKDSILTPEEGMLMLYALFRDEFQKLDVKKMMEDSQHLHAL